MNNAFTNTYGFPRVIAGGLVVLLGVGLLIGYGLRESAAPQVQQRIERK